ncbi:uncharacterized protein LOC127870078 [Dreissena polymorpha]|uniref:uncharacterized protein LOC127870078 n=1 Tax=Dreissena polymorpha TaxID=45954 RepID=UPI0022654433|nr:uncharacterized protein LOC127870078 [Dreissena polymorpha]
MHLYIDGHFYIEGPFYIDGPFYIVSPFYIEVSVWPYHVVCDVILASTLSRNLSTLAPLRNLKSTHFFYTTSKKNVYKLVGQYNVDGKGEDEPNIKSSSDIRDHEFDNPGRLRVKPKAKEAKMDSSRNAVARETLGVQWDCARRNESKLLPTYRLGLDMEEI